MKVSVSDAKSQLTELVRRAEAGTEVILTRHGQETVRLVAINPTPSKNTKKAIMEAARASGSRNALAGSLAERSQDFLYDDDGLPR